MTHRCRVQHCWTEQISLFIGILSYVLSYNFSFYIGQRYIKHFTIKRANNVRPYDCEQKYDIKNGIAFATKYCCIMNYTTT